MSQKRLFGTSGLRGIVGISLFPEMFLKMGLAYANFLKNSGQIIIGSDVRASSPAFKYAFISGLLSGGIDVIDVGIAPTPAVLYVLKDTGADGAAVITGSHAPPDINGLLIFLEDTSEIYGEYEEELEKIYHLDSNKLYPKINQPGFLEEEDFFDIYLDAIQNSVNVKKIAGYEIIIDPGNGAMSKVMGDILELLDVKVIRINDNPNGTFPNRDPYPRKENLIQLSRLSGKLNILGAATDGDGDRVIFTDESGQVVEGDIIGTIFSIEEIKKSRCKVIVTPINASMVLEEAISNYGGKVIYTKVGPPAIIQGLKENNGVFGFEETGKYIWPRNLFYGDALLSTVKLLELISRKNESLSSMINSLPVYFSFKKAIKCPDELKQKVLVEILNHWSKKIENKQLKDVNIIQIDGLKILFEKENMWVLFRPSGTEPVFRVYVNGKIKEKSKSLFDKSVQLVKNVIYNLKNNENKNKNKSLSSP